MGERLDKAGLAQIKGILSTKFATKLDKHPGISAGKFLQTDLNGDATWGEPASPNEIATVTRNWLQDNMPAGETVVVDKSLLTEGAAADAKVTGRIMRSIGPVYNPNKTYNYGDPCVQNGRLYKASQNISTPEEFNSAHWTEDSIMDSIGTAVLYTQQGLSNAQKEQAIKNIGAVGFTWNQTPNDDQKQAARSAIGLPIIDWIINTLTPKQRATARSNFALGIVPELYGAVGDGVTDDKNALSSAISAACSNNVPLYFTPGKVYLTSGYLHVTKRINIYGNGATLKGSGTNENQVINVQCAEGQFPEVTGKGLIENLTIDANGREIGLNIVKAQGFELQNIDVFGFAGTGVLIQGNYEIFAENIRIAGSGSANSVGMKVQCSDSHFTNIITKNVAIGIKNMNWFNFYNHVHSWNTVSSLIENSIMIDNECDLHLAESYIDTCAIGIKQETRLPVYINGMIIYRNNSYMDASFTPVLFSVGNAGNAAQIKGYGIFNENGDSLYNLFDVDVSSSNDFDWISNNDTTISVMGNVPT